MANVKQSKYKADRALGINILGRPKSPLNKRPNKPGMHGAKKVKQSSEFGMCLKECKKLKHFYGDLRDRELKKIVENAMKTKQRKDDEIINKLESRLCSVVYRSKFAITPFFARQLVSHKKILVNGKILNIPSYHVKVGDVISLHESMRNNPHIITSIKTMERKIPTFLSVNGFESKLLIKPNISNTIYPFVINFNLLLDKF